jgi:nuclear pore complex protein Nup62
MDEILTMWSSSLATHQKTFQQLAQKVSVWDRMLVENAGKITELFSRCFQAERDCSEVERQLSNVGHSQTELEHLLERYEAEVDRMMEGAGMGDGGVGVGGVDAERERTYVFQQHRSLVLHTNVLNRYKTAEQCSTRLTEMSHNLIDMISEVNSASAKLNSATQPKNGGEDPLSDIVRTLNQHLQQLQAIDQGASQLQGKVQAAQREARSLGQSQTLNGDNQWVNDFGRSYLGRR